MKTGNLVKALLVLAGLFLLSAPATWATVCSADINCNGRIDGADMFTLVDEANASLRNCLPSTQCLNCAASAMLDCGGTCKDNSTDENNCGSCGNICQYGKICIDGVCYNAGSGCPPELMDCGGTCKDNSTDENNCGTCGSRCKSWEICVNGTCDDVCQVDEIRCGSTCVDNSTDDSNCGSCGNVCQNGKMCIDGACVCKVGCLEDCGGICADLRYDPNNCGTCDNVCESNEVCDNGTCVVVGFNSQSLYLEIDVSGGAGAASYPVTGLSLQPTLPGSYKETRILLRKIDVSGTPFAMGSPDNETGRYSDETRHQVTLTQDYYMGVFEITQRQYELVMGSNPSQHTGDKRPVETVSWDTIRGGVWPGCSLGGGTFIDKLRSKTGLKLDLPTEAQWEYAARATTIRAYNDFTKNGGEGADCTVPEGGADLNLDPLGRYYFNGGDTNQHAIVGSYLPNWWELYDMHGNVYEWCLDWYGSYSGDEIDPLGPGSSPPFGLRVNRGGGSGSYAKLCRSANRNSIIPLGSYGSVGFRLALPQ